MKKFILKCSCDIFLKKSIEKSKLNATISNKSNDHTTNLIPKLNKYNLAQHIFVFKIIVIFISEKQKTQFCDKCQYHRS